MNHSPKDSSSPLRKRNGKPFKKPPEKQHSGVVLSDDHVFPSQAALTLKEKHILNELPPIDYHLPKNIPGELTFQFLFAAEEESQLKN